MADPPGGKRLSASRLLSKLGSGFRRLPSPRPPVQPTASNQKPASVSTIPAISMQSGNITSQDNIYVAIGGLPAAVVDRETRVQHATSVGSAVYEGLKRVLEGLYGCSDMFLPLKTASGAILNIIKVVENVSENKRDLEDLKLKLESIILIVNKYKEDEGLPILGHRIERFCIAVTFHLESVEVLKNQPKWTAVAKGTVDANAILKVFRNISSLCDVFQMDTQLNIEATVGDILRHLDSGIIEKLDHEMTSYKTRQSSYGAPTGCFPGTRVKVLKDLEDWALNTNRSKVYWMVGMAGIGKSTISHSFCEILEAKNMLGGSVFCSRASDKTSNARIIIPVITHALARASPAIACAVVKAIKNDRYLAELSYHNLNEKFKKLIYYPIQTTASKMAEIYKVVIIDALDECVDLDIVSLFIKIVLRSASEIPLKIFISSRDEYKVQNAFKSGDSAREYFYLHDIEKDVVQKDIRQYLKESLADIKDDDSEEWPSPEELSSLVQRSGSLFIYAATAVRYISNGEALYRSRLSEMTTQGLESVITGIDSLYIHVLKKAFEGKPPTEVAFRRDLVSMIVFLRNPLPIEAIASLSEISDAHRYLSSLSSVIHIPNQPGAVVAPFHASFPDFITHHNRCSPEHFHSFHSLAASEGHELLALKCLKQMNRSLKYNICEISEDLTRSRKDITNSPQNVSKISEALKYSCTYWAVHLADIKVFDTILVDELDRFLHKHLLHWIECLSILGELQAGLKSLGSVVPMLSTFKYRDLQLLVDDARRCLQTNFEAVQKHCMEIYQSALVWLPKKSLVRKTYVTDVCKAPKLMFGLSDVWGPMELVMQNGSLVYCVAISQDSSRLVSGSSDKTVRIWNVMTGEVEAELKGHISSVMSVAFSQDGSRVVSGSEDKTVQVWNVTTGEVEAELKGHTESVMSVSFTQDGSRVVSGSDDKTVRIWNVMTGEVEAELKGHTDWVRSVAFSQDGSRVVSGSHDKTVRIWNAMTGEVETELKSHTGWVMSVSFSQDGSRVVSGSDDKTVRIWNVMTGEVEAELKGHTESVMSVAFSQDGSRVVSGSDDKTVRIWNVTMGEVEAELKGHTDWVRSVAFSQDGSRVVSGSDDKTVRIWNVTMGEAEAERKGHTESVMFVAFSQDGSRIVSGSGDNTVRIWNVTMGEVEAELKGHTDWVRSVAFSQDGSQVVSGSDDKTVRIWNVMTGEAEAELKGHTDWVNSVTFSQDGSRVVSGSGDNTVRIWNVTTGEVDAELKGHKSRVSSVAFSQDSSRVVSGSFDKTVRIWDVTTGEVEAELKGHTGWVRSVAFSQDGNQVVSGSGDNTVRIWDVATGNFQLATSSNAILPDGGMVIRTGNHPWEFCITYPLQQPTLSTNSALWISVDGHWIIGTICDCWIPSHYRNFDCSSIWGSRICLGYPSGRVVILDICTDEGRK